jgi:RND family efflux transporter MFP subunit
MLSYFPTRQPFVCGGALAVLLLTAAAAWLWAHEGHQPLPSTGVRVDVDKGLLTLSEPARRALGVQTAPVQRLRLEERIPAPATVVAPWQQHAYAASRVSGRIAALHVQPGQPVPKGHVLAEVESLELENLQLEWLTARNDLKLAADNLKQLEAAHAKGTIPEQTLYEAQARRREADNVLAIARLKLLALGVSDAQLARLERPSPEPLRTLPITSPIGGTVIHVDVQVGQVVEPSQHLFEIVDLSSVWLKAGVLEKDLHRVSVGQPLELQVTAYPGRVVRSEVEVKGLYLDPQTHLGTVWGRYENEQPADAGRSPPGPGSQAGSGPLRLSGRPRLLPGMFGQAELIVPGPGESLVVPAAAVLRAGAERYVLLEEGPGQYVRKNIVTGLQTPELIQVLDGQLLPGDHVVTTGSQELASFFVEGVLRLSPQAERNIGLKVEPARKQSLAEVVEVSGAIDLPPGRRAVVAARLPGILHRIAVDRDQVVPVGAVVAEVASLEFHNLQLELLRSQLQLELLEETRKRLRPLAEQNNPALSQRLWRETESAYQAALQRRDSLRRNLEAVGLAPEQVGDILEKRRFVAALPVRAPIAGAVVRFQAVLGQAVRAEEPLFEIHDLSEPLVRGYVSERQLAAVRLGQSARVRLLADPGFAADAVVVRSGQVFGVEDRTVSVWAQLSDETKLRAGLLDGMLARLVLVVAESPPTLAAPREALLRDGSRTYLFVRQPDGLFQRRLVQTGRGDDRYVEITRGLKEGEAVAVRGVADLQTAYAGLK